jgi:hypothetical protein
MNKVSGLLVAGSIVVCGLCSFAVNSAAKPDAPNGEEWERQIIALVERLGNERFEEREAAHDALVRKGDAILPILNKLEPGIDPEIRHRVNRIRRELGGFREEIRDLLAKTPATQHDVRPPIFAKLDQLIESHQPKSGDFLLSIIARRRFRPTTPAVLRGSPPPLALRLASGTRRSRRGTDLNAVD